MCIHIYAMVLLLHLQSNNSDKSYNLSLDCEKIKTKVLNENIPNLTEWNKYQVYEYLADLLPNEVAAKIIKNVRYIMI